MAAPVTSTTTTTLNQVPATTSTTSSTSAGVGATASSISSAADNQGFSAQISAWVSNCVDSIRKCLAKLPLIGYWFDKGATPATTTTTTTTTTTADADLLTMIRASFVAAPAAGAAAPAVPDAAGVNYLLGLFAQIQSPVVKMGAFHSVLSAANSTDDIARQFYNSLPEGTAGTTEASKNSFKHQLWVSNGRNDNGMGVGFGDHILNNAPRGPLALQAAQDLRTALAPATTTTSTTTTSTTTTTAATTTMARALADANRINQIRATFTAAGAATTAVSTASIANVVALFQAIQSPVIKMDALNLILTDPTSTDVIAQQCINGLPDGDAGTVEPSKNALKLQIWEANGRNDGGHGVNFGAHTIGVDPRGLLVRTAANSLRALIVARAP